MSKEDEQIEDDSQHRAKGQFQNFFINSRDGIYRSTKTGEYIDANPALVEMLGYDSKEELLSNSIPEEIYAHGEERPGPQERGEIFTVQLKRRDCSLIWVDINSWVVKNEAGEVLYYEGIVRDVTQRQRYLEELTAAKEKLRITLKSIGDGVIVTDIEGKIDMMNRKAEELTGYREENVCGYPLEEVFNIVNEFSRKPVTNPVQKVIASGELEGLANHTILISKNGREKAIADSAAPIKDNEDNIKGVAMVFRDVTERRKMVRDLKFKEGKYRTLFENTGTALGIIREDTVFSMVNEEMVKLTGYSRQEIEGKLSWTKLVASDKKLEQMKEYHELRRKEKVNNPPPRSYEFTLQDKQGEKKHVLIRVSMIPDTTKSIVSIMDITERKKYEDRIRYLGYHDEMTGLYNRNYFKEAMDRLDTARQLPLSIIMGDINGLKLINDGFGHREGDELIKKTARVIDSCCRKEDIVARWGGDEFVILLPQTKNEEAAQIKDRIKKVCGESEEEPVRPSIALGFATKTGPEQDLEEILQKAEKWVYKRKLIESKSIRSSIISSLEETLLEKDYETREHAERIKEQAIKLGRALDLPENRLDELELLASLHDIGKIAIDDEILLKPAALDDDEWEIVKKHTDKGYRIAQASSELASISEAILYHHEWWDGSGYPHGLQGEEIPLSSRIIAVVDAYDVMLNGRPYKEPMSKEQALEELKRCAGTQFDPYLVKVFIKKVLREE